MDLNKLYSKLFKTAGEFQDLSFFIELIILIITIALISMTSIFASNSGETSSTVDDLIFIFTIIILLLKAISEFIKKLQKEKEIKGHSIQEIHHLRIAYGKDKFKSELSEIIAKIDSKTIKFCRLKENSENLESSKTFIEIIRENSFWNNYLYKEAGKKKLRFVMIFIIIIVISLVFTVRYASSDVIPNTLLAVLGGSILISELKLIWKLRNGAEYMETLEQEIDKLEDINNVSTETQTYLYSKYARIKFETPLIKDSIYKSNREKLNIAWNEKMK